MSETQLQHFMTALTRMPTAATNVYERIRHYEYTTISVIYEWTYCLQQKWICSYPPWLSPTHSLHSCLYLTHFLNKHNP